MRALTEEEILELEEWFRREIVPRLPIEMRLAGLTAEEVMSHYSPEERVAGLDLKQRLAGLDEQQLALILPIELLRALRDDYINTFTPEVQQKIRQRLRDETH